MKILGTILATIFISTAAAQAAISIETVTVGDINNANDPTTGYGSVGYTYNIGKYEVTIGQYTAFLNAVAATDTYSLYNTNMGTNLNVAGISRSGSTGNFTYSVMTNSGYSANRPITYVSWFDAARFANWMANGQTTGLQGNATTENGAYALNGATSGGLTIEKNTTNPNTGQAVNWWIPSENEWYKAAYYSPGASSDSYWLYPTQSDSAPGNTRGSGANQANFYISNYSTGTAPYITNGGAYSASASHYGTFDQGGNLWEWNDAVISGSYRGLRGGSWYSSYSLLQSSIRIGSLYPVSEGYDIGFRVASVPAAVPEPSAAVLVMITGAGWLVWKRKKIAV